MSSKPRHAISRPNPAPLVAEKELATRWRKSVRTLQRWRRAASGPAFLRIGGSFFYRMCDIVAFEESSRHDGRGGQ